MHGRKNTTGYAEAEIHVLISVLSLYSKVGKDDLETSKSFTVSSKSQLEHPLVNQYSLTLGQDLGQHDTKSLIKCVETLSFIVRDAAHVTPDNFELCVRAIRVFVEANLNGGENVFHFIAPPDFEHQFSNESTVFSAP